MLDEEKGAGTRRAQIVTDSIADIPAPLVSDLDISVIPCQYFFGSEAYLDGVDLSPQEFFDKLAQSAELPQTSQPTVHEFAHTYREILDRNPDSGIISIHAPGNLSGIVNAAWSGAQMLPDPSRVVVIDSGQVSMGMGWAVVEAARMAQAGASQAEVAQKVQGLLSRLRAAAMLDTLDNLYKGGRISKISATLGTALQIKPIIEIREGQVAVVSKVRTRSRALKYLASMVRDWAPLAEIALLHTGAEELMHTLADMLHDQVLGDELPRERMLLMPAGSALTVHLGLGAVGITALLRERPMAKIEKI